MTVGDYVYDITSFIAEHPVFSWFCLDSTVDTRAAGTKSSWQQEALWSIFDTRLSCYRFFILATGAFLEHIQNSLRQKRTGNAADNHDPKSSRRDVIALFGSISGHGHFGKAPYWPREGRGPAHSLPLSCFVPFVMFACQDRKQLAEVTHL